MKPLVALFNPILSHYRAALIHELTTRSKYDFYFFADGEDAEGQIPTMAGEGTMLFTGCRTRRLPWGLRWQTNTVGACMSPRFAAVILLGNAHWLSSWLGAIAARAAGKPVLFWTHGWTREDQGVTRVIRKAFYGLANGLLLYGDRAHRIGLSVGFNVRRLQVMYNSLDVDRQSALLANLSSVANRQMRWLLFQDTDTPVVIAAARLTEGKRFDLAIRAISEVNRNVRKVNLLIVGDGPQRTALQRLAKDLRVNAYFAGACYDEAKMAQYFCCAAVTVSPGNVGLTCMHSMGYGVPVITHNDPAAQNPECEAIEPGVNGDLFEKSSIEDLQRKIAKWTISPEVSVACASACLQVIKKKYRPDLQRIAIEAALDRVRSLRDA